MFQIQPLTAAAWTEIKNLRYGFCNVTALNNCARWIDMSLRLCLHDELIIISAAKYPALRYHARLDCFKADIRSCTKLCG